MSAAPRQQDNDGEDGIVTEHLDCGYEGRAVLTDVNVHIPTGQITCVLGKSGCGKSTLLRTLLLLEPPLKGDIRFDGKSILEKSRAGLDELRRNIGVLFQGAALFNSMTLLENAAFPLVERTRIPPELAEELALLKLNLVGLSKYARYLPASVSGGMRKRCGIARALALDPPYLFLDEPSAGLDPVTAADIDRLLIEIRDSLGTTMLVITHELSSIREISDRVAMIDEGRIVAEGTLAEVESSDHPAVRDFFARRAPPLERQARDGLSSLLLP